MSRVLTALAMAALAAIALLAVTAGSSVSAPVADVTSVLTLKPGIAAASKVTYTFKHGVAYTITVSGLIVSKDPANSSTCGQDAFFESCSSDPSVKPTSDVGFDVTLHGTGSGTIPGAPQTTATFQSSHSYTWEVPKTWFTGDQKSDIWAWPYGRPYDSTTTYSGSLTMTIVAHEQQTAQRCKAPWAAGDLAHAAKIDEVHVVCVQPDAQFHKGGTPPDAWLPLEVDTVLKAGDEVTTDPDGAVTIAFADNSTVVVSDTTQLKIGSFFTEGGVVKTEILLKMGQIAAQVCKSCATKSDFRIKSPTGTISVRGTIFTVFYDPGSGATLESTERGLVSVSPADHQLKAVSVGPGREVEFTRSTESRVAPIGQAGARGGLDVLGARSLVLAVVAANNRACATSTPRSGAFALRPIAGGWRVSVKLIGRLQGTSTWTVIAGHARPVNALAAVLARGCR